MPSPGAASPAASVPRTFEDNWRKAVHDGFVPNTASPTRTVAANTAFLSQPQPAATASGPLEITILPDPSVYDGRFALLGNHLTNVPLVLGKGVYEVRVDEKCVFKDVIMGSNSGLVKLDCSKVKNDQ